MLSLLLNLYQIYNLIIWNRTLWVNLIINNFLIFNVITQLLQEFSHQQKGVLWWMLKIEFFKAFKDLSALTKENDKNNNNLTFHNNLYKFSKKRINIFLQSNFKWYLVAKTKWLRLLFLSKAILNVWKYKRFLFRII